MISFVACDGMHKKRYDGTKLLSFLAACSLSLCSYFLLIFFYRLLQVSLSVSATEVRAHHHERVHCGLQLSSLSSAPPPCLFVNKKMLALNWLIL